MGADEIIVAGGGEIYAQTIARASRLFITEVALDAEGEARFPPIDPKQWREVRRETGERGPRDEADFAFVEIRAADDPRRLLAALGCGDAVSDLRPQTPLPKAAIRSRARLGYFATLELLTAYPFRVEICSPTSLKVLSSSPS